MINRARLFFLFVPFLLLGLMVYVGFEQQKYTFFHQRLQASLTAQKIDLSPMQEKLEALLPLVQDNEVRHQVQRAKAAIKMILEHQSTLVPQPKMVETNQGALMFFDPQTELIENPIMNALRRIDGVLQQAEYQDDIQYTGLRGRIAALQDDLQFATSQPNRVAVPPEVDLLPIVLVLWLAFIAVLPAWGNLVAELLRGRRAGEAKAAEGSRATLAKEKKAAPASATDFPEKIGETAGAGGR